MNHPTPSLSNQFNDITRVAILTLGLISPQGITEQKNAQVSHILTGAPDQTSQRIIVQTVEHNSPIPEKK